MNTENTGAEQEPLVLKSGQRIGQWVIDAKLDEGGFGQVYKVHHRKDEKKVAALKAEPTDQEGGAAIKLEIVILLTIQRRGEAPHIPAVLHSAKRKKFCYMVMSLLGPNLKTLKLETKSNRFSLSTWTRLGIQCLYSLKVLHDNGFVHRDIKPANFAMGHPSDPERARFVFLLDFGLARSYAKLLPNGKWQARLARGCAEFRGTVRYCSPTVHDKEEQGRKDDLWSLMYVLIEFNFGLPWQLERDRTRLEDRKLTISDEELMKNFPKELHKVIPHLREQNPYSRPDYSMIYECLLKLIEKNKIKYTDRYDWEKSNMPADTKPAPYENATEFFKSDPIKINSVPKNKEEAKVVDHMVTADDVNTLMKGTEILTSKESPLKSPSLDKKTSDNQKSDKQKP